MLIYYLWRIECRLPPKAELDFGAGVGIQERNVNEGGFQMNIFESHLWQFSKYFAFKTDVGYRFAQEHSDFYFGIGIIFGGSHLHLEPNK